MAENEPNTPEETTPAPIPSTAEEGQDAEVPAEAGAGDEKEPVFKSGESLAALGQKLVEGGQHLDEVLRSHANLKAELEAEKVGREYDKQGHDTHVAELTKVHQAEVDDLKRQIRDALAEE